MFQQVILAGNVGSDPELRYTSKGIAVVNFSMATNEHRKDADDHTEWHRVVAWMQLAEIINEHVKKGSSVLVTGQLRTRSWEDKEGNTKSTTEVHVRDFRFIGKKEPVSAVEEKDDDDIPFDL